MTFDNLVMVTVSVVLVALAYTGMHSVRWEGAMLIAAYLGYLW